MQIRDALGLDAIPEVAMDWAQLTTIKGATKVTRDNDRPGAVSAYFLFQKIKLQA